MNFAQPFVMGDRVRGALSAFGADELAHQTIAAIKGGQKADALAYALIFATQYGNAYPEAHALCAHTLSQFGYGEMALDFWDKALRLNPDHIDWLAHALQTAWQIKAGKKVRLYEDMLRHSFLTPPPPSFLSVFSALNKSIQGSCGIHTGQLRGWLWLAKDKTFAFHAEKAPSLPKPTLQKNSFGEYTLYTFSLPLANCDHSYTLSVTVDGAHIPGSPVSCFPSQAARPTKKGHSKGLTIVIPCYDDRKATLSCIASVLASRTHNTTPNTILAVWDHGPDATLYCALKRLAKRHSIALINTPTNMGFLGTVNFALSLLSDGDVLLLNSDTLVHGNWIDRMAAIGKNPDAGTVTAMGSEAELLSFPSPSKRGTIRSLRETAILDNACKALPPDMHVREIPVGVGFCMLLTRKALRTLYGFDGLTLCRGYGEETEFCLRCKEAGLKNYAACNVYVAHLGGRSFKAAKKALARQNNKAIFAHFPNYKQEYDRFLLEDPLRRIREHISRAACATMGGEVYAYPWARMYALPKEESAMGDYEQRATLFVLPQGSELTVVAKMFPGVELAAMRFDLPNERKALSALVQNAAFTNLIVQGRPAWAKALAEALALPLVHETKALGVLRTAELNSDNTSLLAPPPLSIKGWRTLCRYAQKWPSATIYVYNLQHIWDNVPRPKNIVPLPDISDLRPLQLSSVVFAEKADEHDVQTWRTWLSTHGGDNLPLALLPKESA